MRRKNGQPVEPIGVDQGKSLIYARLRLPEHGPGYLHFPADPAFDDEYFAQLAAEILVKRARGGRIFAEWKQMRPRNEALDCLLLALAACRLAGPLPDGRSIPAPSPTSKFLSAESGVGPPPANPAEVFAAMMAARREKSRVRR